MTKGLVRFQQSGDLHFITFSCSGRKPYLRSLDARELFEHSLEMMRTRYDFFISGYVVMPEHVHLLASEPKKALIGKAMQALKLSISVQSRERPFWLARYCDFNVFSEVKLIEKLRYIHRNPVTRGLVAEPASWIGSSFLHYSRGETGTVEVESQWTAALRECAR